MPKFNSLLERVMLHPGSGVIAASGTTITGDWVSFQDYNRIAALVAITRAGSNATTITVDKATSIAGANESTGITFNYWYMEDVTTTTGIGIDVGAWTKGTAAASITTDTSTASHFYLIDIGADELNDGVSPFTSTTKYIAIQVNVSQSTNVGQFLLYMLYEPRYSAATMPSAIA